MASSYAHWEIWARTSLFFILIHQMTLAAAAVSIPEGLELKYRIEEELPSGTFVGDVIRDANLASIYDSAALQRLQFRFLKQQRAEGGFVIDSGTGVIRTQGRIDREELCPSAASCDLRLDVAVQPVEYFRIIRINISILDVNDNWPKFADQERIVELLESVVVGHVLFRPEASDSDGPSFSVQAYKLFSDSDRFTLTSPDLKPDGSFKTELVIAKTLDRETTDRFSVQIVALDGGFPPKTSSIALTIYVLDVNDNQPEFDQISYDTVVDESIPIGTSLLQVRATDKDLGLNGAVFYTFDLQTLSSYGELFLIDNVTGEISTRGLIDYERTPSYKLVVVARDKGMDSKPSTATVTINLEDMNDSPPEITVDTLSEAVGVAEIREDVPVGTFVGHVTVADADSGRNGQFRCALNDPNFQLLPVYETEFQIVTAMLLDREVKDEYNVTLSCRDLGSQPMTTSKDIRIKVGDVNDNSPEFLQESYRGDLIENNYVGASIVTVTAKDNDVGPNGDVTYSLSGDLAQSFLIDPRSGLVTAAVRFDREQNEVIKFHVVATDGGAESRNSSALVVFTVFDVNDEQPIFVPPQNGGYSFSVGENLVEGSEVGTVVATDRDSNIYGEVTYSIVQSSPHASMFHMDRKTGVITTSSVLDREEVYSYHLVAVASDRGVPPKSTSVNVTIYVSDDNDNAPVFDFPTIYNNTLQISTVAPVGHIITRLRAHDMDTGRNAKIIFVTNSITATNAEIPPNETAAYFDLDSEWGTLMVGRDLSNLHGRRFRLDFLAKDQGPEPRSSDPVYLNVIINQSAPLFVGGRRSGDNPDGNPWVNTLTQNLIIVIAIAVGSGIVIVILIIAIVMIRRQDGSKAKAQKYNCRAEAMKMLSKDGGAEGGMRPGEGGDLTPDCDDSRYAAYESKGKLGLGLSPDSLREYKHGQDLSLMSDSSCHQKQLSDQDMSNSMLQSNSNINSTLPIQNRHQSASVVDGARCSPLCYSPKPQNKELEVERLLRALQRDNDTGSEHSGEGSNTDSGRGISEEGENGLHTQQLQQLRQQQQQNANLPECDSSIQSKPLNSAPYSCSAGNNGNTDKAAPIVPNGTYHRYDMGDYYPPPLLSSQIPCSTNNLSLVDPSHKTPQHHVNSFGSTGLLHRSNIDSANAYSTADPNNDVILQNALNDGFLMNGYSTGTSPRSAHGYQRPPISPHSATLPQRTGVGISSDHGRYNMMPAGTRNIDSKALDQNRARNNFNGQPHPPQWVMNSCRSPSVKSAATPASQIWTRTPGTAESEYGTPYSCGDISDVLSGERIQNSVHFTPDNRRPPPYLVDGNTGKTSLGSCVPDPNELCREIDELFFSNMRTSNL